MSLTVLVCVAKKDRAVVSGDSHTPLLIPTFFVRHRSLFLVAAPVYSNSICWLEEAANPFCSLRFYRFQFPTLKHSCN
jgi:hypothetical protein